MDLENDGDQRSAMYVEDTETGRAISQRGPGLTQKQKKEAVDYHNKLRRQEGASNMETLVSSVASSGGGGRNQEKEFKGHTPTQIL